MPAFANIVTLNGVVLASNHKDAVVVRLKDVVPGDLKVRAPVGACVGAGG